jgi:hypothetical protein
LHLACRLYISDKVVLQLLNSFPQSSSKKPTNGYYALNLAISWDQSDTVVLQLLNSFPQAASEKCSVYRYPLHTACEKNRSEKVVLQLLKCFPKAATKKHDYDGYPLHDAIANHQSESVILALLDFSLLAVKDISQYGDTLLSYARNYSQSKAFVNLLETLMKMSDYDLENRINLPMKLLANGFYNRQRQDSYQWLLLNLSTKQTTTTQL